MYIFEGRQKVGFCCNFTYFFIILPPMFLLIVLCQYPSFVLFSNLPKKAWEISRKQHCAWDTSTSSLLLVEWTFPGKGEEPHNSGEDPQPHSCMDFRETDSALPYLVHHLAICAGPRQSPPASHTNQAQGKAVCTSLNPLPFYPSYFAEHISITWLTSSR